MKYTPAYFYRNTPKWKLKKDATIVRVFYRPLSFVVASLCANLHISANFVSYFSAFIAIISCSLLYINNYVCNIVGASLIQLWILLDCVDGDLARCVRKEPFGDFADAISSYLLVGFLGIGLGLSVYFNGGILFNSGNPWVIVMGGLGSSSDTMMRLIYQKYHANENEMVNKGQISPEKEVRTDSSQVSSLRVRIESEFGLSLLALLVLLCVIFKVVDIALVYFLVYYGGSFLVMLFLYVGKAIKKAKGKTIE